MQIFPLENYSYKVVFIESPAPHQDDDPLSNDDVIPYVQQ